MTRTPLVSVLMPVFNGLPYLRQAIESVLRQTWEDFELLVVDDASTDGSAPCVESYTDVRIRLIRCERNAGQAAALNRGLSVARGRYVARLDQDDVCLPDRLRRQVEALERRPALAAVGTWAYWIGPDGGRRGVVGLRVDDFGAFLGILLTRAVPAAHPTVMFRREALEAVGGYDPAFAPSEDYELWCRLARRRQWVAVIREPLAMLRIHSAQQSVAGLPAQSQQMQRAQERLIGTFCRPEATARVSALLRAEERVWQQATSMEHVSALLDRLEEAVDNLARALSLSDEERASLTGRLSWWLGGQAVLAVLQRHRQSATLYRWSLRATGRTWRYASTYAFPLGWLGSRLLPSSWSQPLLAAARRAHHQRYRWRLLTQTPNAPTQETPRWTKEPAHSR